MSYTLADRIKSSLVRRQQASAREIAPEIGQKVEEVEAECERLFQAGELERDWALTREGAHFETGQGVFVYRLARRGE